MLVRLTSGNRLTLPERILEDFPGVECFEVVLTEGGIRLTPVSPVKTEKIERIRAKIAGLGIEESEVRDAVKWARRQTD